ncbi:MAG TPA: cupin domain-containing protein [Natronoarchaeum rubrum]|nr:cupin domain-containing protein [Natronoarchaeum rubrum]
MARSGTTIDNPKTGEHVTFLETADETDGDRLRFEYDIEAGGAAIAPHSHPRQRERIEVRSGVLSARVGGEEGTVLTGQTLLVPAETPHYVWNVGPEPVRTVVELDPALRTEEFFETTFGLARDGETDADGRPSTLQFAVLADEFAEEIAFELGPDPLRRPATALLGAIGRAAGYQGTYPAYTREPVEAEPPRRY